MATGRKTVVVGQVIDPVTWGNPVWDQSVQQFASAADRTSQFGTPLKGAVTWLDDVARLEVWNGALWVPVTGFTPPGTWPAPVVGAINVNRPIETFGYTATIATNASGDGDAPLPAGLTLGSIISAAIIGRGSTAFNITGFLFGSSTLAAPRFRVYNANVAAASTSIAVGVTVTGQRA